MNRILLIISATLSTLILASVVFVAFFHYDNRMQARAFIVVAPTSVMGATAIDTVTRTAVALAMTDDFRARFINDLTVSGTAFDEEDLAQTVFRQETPGLISVTAFTRDEDAPIARIATSGAYSLMHTIQAYFETASVYTFTVIDGARVAQPARMGLVSRLVLSGLIGALSMALIFAIVFSARTARGTGRAHRYHGHIHASQAQIDLKLPPQKKQNVADDYDYMRDMYADYDASLENLSNTQSVEMNEENLAEEVRSYDEEDNIEDEAQTTQEATQKSTVEEAPLGEGNESDVPIETPSAVPSQQESAPAPRTATPLQKAQEKSAQTLQATKGLAKRTQHASQEKVMHSLRALSALFHGKDGDSVSAQDAKEPQRGTPETDAQNSAVTEEDSAPKRESVARTASPPPNLPTMPLSQVGDADSATKGDDRTDDVSKSEHDPTSAEVRKRLNELLSGKPPKVSP